MRTFQDNASKFLRLLTQRQSRYPHEVQIEVTNACNLKCAMCPHTFGAIPTENFPFDLFQQIVRHNPPPKRLVLTGWGEPFLHPRFFEMIASANTHWQESQIRFTTNGMLLHAENRTRIHAHHIAGVTVSVDCYPDTGTWDTKWTQWLHPPSPKIIRHINAYLDDTALLHRTPLILQSILVEENVQDIQLYIDLLSGYPRTAMNLVRFQIFAENGLRRMSWETEQRLISDLIRYGTSKGVLVRSINQQPFYLRMATHHDRYCLKTDDSLYINIDGSCTPCCNLRDFSIGALQNAHYDLSSIWRSSASHDFFHHQPETCGGCDALFHQYKES